MELRQLRHFIAVAETNHYGQAAQRVNISQPALTRSIKTLESDLGVRLLERGPKGAVATEAGERFLEYARLILNDCQRAREGIRTDEPTLTGRVSVGVAALFGSWITDEVVIRVSREHPGIRLEVTEGYYEDLTSGLAEGRFDFALSNIPSTPGERDLVAEPLLALDAAIVCGMTHPLARRSSLRGADLTDTPWVIVSHPHSVELFRQYFIGQGLTPPPFVSTNSLALLRSLVVSGNHLSMVCEPVLHRELRRGIVRSLPVDKELGQRRAGLLYLRRAARPGAIERVMRIVRECCAEESEVAQARRRPPETVATVVTVPPAATRALAPFVRPQDALVVGAGECANPAASSAPL